MNNKSAHILRLRHPNEAKLVGVPETIIRDLLQEIRELKSVNAILSTNTSVLSEKISVLDRDTGKIATVIDEDRKAVGARLERLEKRVVELERFRYLMALVGAGVGTVATLIVAWALRKFG